MRGCPVSPGGPRGKGTGGARPAGSEQEAPVQAEASGAPPPGPHSRIRRNAVTRLWASWSWGPAWSSPQWLRGGICPRAPGAKLLLRMELLLPTPSGYTVTYSLKVTVRQFAVTSVIIIFPKKGLNSLSGSSGSSWASAGAFSAAVTGADATAPVAGASGFT